MGDKRLVVDVEKRLAAFRLQVRLEVGTEVLVLFGPSGAGKTTTLDLIAGLADPDSGEISLDGTPFYQRDRRGRTRSLPARKRRVGYVFQHYALFPHLTAVENVAFPLRRHRRGRERALELLERMRLSHLADRFPYQLSGGQQQRLAVARALAVDPRLLLMDEPFSAVDAAMRERIQRDLIELQEELRLVVIYVTHRLEDAFAMGDRIAVVREGQIEQVGPIDDVFRRPSSDEIAEIMGIRNVFRARVVESTPESLVLDWNGMRLEAEPQPAEVGAEVTAYIQPEDIKILYPDRPLTRAVRHNQITGRIIDIRLTPLHRSLQVELETGYVLEVRSPPYAYTPLRMEVGEPLRLSLRKEALVVVQA